MEIRRTYAGSAVPKVLMVSLAACAAIALAGAAGVVGKSLIGSGASTQTTVHPAAGTVLRQDNPVQQSGLLDRNAERIQGSAGISNGVRTTGNQIASDDASLAAGAHGPDSDLTRVLPTKPAAYDPGWDSRSVREGHGQ